MRFHECGRATLVALVAGLALSERAFATAVDAGGPEELGSFALVATGDIMMHEAVKQAAAANGFGPLFAQAAPALQAADAAFGNLETPVAPRADRGSRPFVFNAPLALLPALKTAGFGLLSLANNHAYDQGVAGVAETVSNLAEAGLREIGAGRTRAEAEAPVVIAAHGVKVGFLGATARFNQNLNSDRSTAPYVQPADPEPLAAAVAQLAATVDAVVVSVHWGNEYQAEPAADQTALARRLVEAGALVVLGSHPHVLQPVELLPGPGDRLALVAFSLGNFISNQSREYADGPAPSAAGDPRDGVLLKITLRKRRYLGDQVVTELGPVEALPLWTDNNTLLRKGAGGQAVDIHVVDIDAELRADRGRVATLAGHAAALTAVERREARRLQQRIELLDQRRARIGERLGPYLPASP